MATYMRHFSHKLLQTNCWFPLSRGIPRQRNIPPISRQTLRHASVKFTPHKKGQFRKSLVLLTGVSATGLCVWNSVKLLFSLRNVAKCHTGEAEALRLATYDQFAVDTPRILSKEDASRFKLTLYQYHTCPFCCKVRTFLDYYGFPYTIVEVDPIRRKEIKFSEYRKVPIVVCKTSDGKELQLNDSSVIISALTTYMGTDNKDIDQIISFFPVVESEGKRGKKSIDYLNKHEIMLGKPGRTPKEKAEKKWREWVDKKLVHYLSPNIYRTPAEALQAFDYISLKAGFSGWDQFVIKYAGAGAMYFVSKRLKKKYGLPSDVRQALYDAANDWVKAVGKQQFLGGSEPCLADLNVFGVLSSIEGFDAFNDMLRETKIGPWYYRTKAAVYSSDDNKPLED